MISSREISMFQFSKSKMLQNLNQESELSEKKAINVHTPNKKPVAPSLVARH